MSNYIDLTIKVNYQCHEKYFPMASKINILAIINLVSILPGWWKSVCHVFLNISFIFQKLFLFFYFQFYFFFFVFFFSHNYISLKRTPNIFIHGFFSIENIVKYIVIPKLYLLSLTLFFSYPNNTVFVQVFQKKDNFHDFLFSHPQCLPCILT